jgi:hypothetical protein
VYVSQQLAGADWVEIAGPYDAPAHRYRGRQVYGGVDEALVAMGDRYASLEWDRFEHERAAPRPVVPTSPPHAARSPEEPIADCDDERAEAGTERSGIATEPARRRRIGAPADVGYRPGRAGTCPAGRGIRGA